MTPKTEEIIEKIVEEFENTAYPIVHSNTFPDKDCELLKGLSRYVRTSLETIYQQGREEVVGEVETILDKYDGLMIGNNIRKSISALLSPPQEKGQSKE